MIMAGHEVLKFVCYSISQEPNARANSRSTGWPSGSLDPSYQWRRREDYNRAARLDEFLPWFEDWRFDWLDVPGLIRNCPHAYEYPLVDRDPVDRWTFGRVTLMGDAAHPMYPIGSNGAPQAILDARVITRGILGHAAKPRRRLRPTRPSAGPRTTELVKLNRRNGPEQVMQLVEEPRSRTAMTWSPTCCRGRSWKTSPTTYKRVADPRSRRSTPSRRSCRAPAGESVARRLTRDLRGRIRSCAGSGPRR